VLGGRSWSGRLGATGFVEERVMRQMAVLATVVAVLAGGAAAQDAAKVPAPQKEHGWLKQLEGDWETESEVVLEPGKPPAKIKGTENVRSLGGFWTVAEMKSDLFGTPATGVMTVGYDAKKKKYVGTFVSSMSDLLYHYEGTADGNVLTLQTQGPSPTDPDKLVKMKDVIEVKSKDLRVLTSYALGDNGKWVPFVTMTCRRKK
jgi:hypothetical protein